MAAPLAPSFPVLMGARVLQGLGAAAVPVRRLLVKEKELTRARDALAAERRRMPMGGTWASLDLTALARQEQWEGSPEGYPQTPAYEWLNWHDGYGEAAMAEDWSDQVQRGVQAFRDN